MELEEWINLYCQDADNLEINKEKDRILIINKRANNVFIICKKAMEVAKKQRAIGRDIEDLMKVVSD